MAGRVGEWLKAAHRCPVSVLLASFATYLATYGFLGCVSVNVATLDAARALRSMPSNMTDETLCAGAPTMFNTTAREIEGTPPAREAPPPPARHWLESGQSGAGSPAAIAPRSPTPNLSPPHRNSPLVGQGGRAFHTEWPTKLRRFPPGLSQFRWHFPTSTWSTKLRSENRHVNGGPLSVLRQTRYSSFTSSRTARAAAAS